jgi:two-component system response regulator PilR (NtrC family)
MAKWQTVLQQGLDRLKTPEHKDLWFKPESWRPWYVNCFFLESMKRILIVDDKPLIRHGLSKTLGDLAEIKSVVTGEEAIRELTSSFYDLCFLDINLPDLNGVEVMALAKEICPRTKVALMTASHVDDDLRRAIEAKADYFVAKPFGLSDVKVLAEEALQDKQEETSPD